MQTCVKILQFMFLLILNYFHITCFDQYGHWQVLWKLLLKTAALPSLNTIPKYTLVYVHMCCCAFVVLGDSTYILCAAVNRGYKGILKNCIQWRNCSSSQQKYSKHPMVTIFFYYYYWWGGTKSPGTAATSSLLYKPHMIDEDDCGAIGGMKIGRGNRSTWRKPAPAPLLSTTNPTWPDPGMVTILVETCSAPVMWKII
jgi:hypothetical protein